MTRDDDTLDLAVAALDRVIARNREKFERSLVTHHAPTELLAFLREWEADRAEAWRAEQLAAIAERLHGASTTYTVH